jgi:hypothetical protein
MLLQAWLVRNFSGKEVRAMTNKKLLFVVFAMLGATLLWTVGCSDEGGNADTGGQEDGKDAGGDPGTNNDGGKDAGGDPGSGDPGQGDPGSGDPGQGDPGGGDPGQGDPGSGDPGQGDPGSGDPGQGDPGGGDNGGQGACMNGPDLTIIEAQGQDALVSEAATCAQGCFLNPDRVTCIAECVSTNTGLSMPCSMCFGGIADCVIDNCLSSCISDPQSQECLDCTNQNCMPGFETCSGLDATP